MTKKFQRLWKVAEARRTKARRDLPDPRAALWLLFLCMSSSQNRYALLRDMH